jgi:hypothetical protein
MYAAQLAGVFLAAKSGGVLERMRADMIPFIFDETGKTYFPMGISKAGEYLDELDPRMADRARDVLEGLLMMLYR